MKLVDLVSQEPLPKPRLSVEDRLREVRNSAYRLWKLRLDTSRLSADERAELSDLAVAASGERTDLSLVETLPKSDRRKLEKLIERSSGNEGWFDQQREQATLSVKLRQLAAAARRPARRIRYEQEGAVVLPARLVRAYLEERMDAACFVTLIDAIVHEQVVGGEHIVDRPLARHDKDGLIPTGRAAKRLTESGWLEAQKIGGNRIKLSYGRHLRRAFSEMETNR
jgi:hypothetical protein